MKYLPYIIYLVSFTTGFANLSLLILTGIKTRDRIHLLHGIILGALAAYLVVFDLFQVSWDLSGGRFIWPGGLFHTVYLGSRIPLYLLVIPFFTALFGLDKKSSKRRALFLNSLYPLFILAAVASGIFIIGAWLVNPWYYRIIFIPVLKGSDIFIFAAGASAILTALLRDREKSRVSETVRWGMILLLILFVPFWFIQIFHREIGIRLDTIFHSENILFFLWNLGSIIWYIRYLTVPRTVPAAADSLNILSAREKEIALLASQGKSNKEIAIALKISPATVKNHLYSLYPKLGVPSRYELIDLVNRQSRPDQWRQ